MAHTIAGVLKWEQGAEPPSPLTLTTVMALPEAENCLPIHAIVSTHYQRLTDGRTERNLTSISLVNRATMKKKPRDLTVANDRLPVNLA